MGSHSRTMTWRHRLYRQLHPTAWHKRGLSPLNRIIAVLICLGVAMAVLQSEPEILNGRERLFRIGEVAFAVVFLVEYLARLWIAAENPRYGPGWRGVVRYVISFPALIDLLALSSLFMTLLGGEGVVLRLFRLSRMLMLARLGRFSTAIGAIVYAVKSRRYELIMSLAIAVMLLLVSSTLLFIIEGPGQAEDFGSIPRAMWWSIATLTTVGYGDAYPVTAIGKVVAGLTAVTGIGLIAMPTGILAAAFSDAIQIQRKVREEKDAKRDA